MSLPLQILRPLLLFTIFSACVSASKYNSIAKLKSEQDLKLENLQALQDQNSSLQIEINNLKTQLRTTELVLSDLYLKYEGKNFYPESSTNSTAPPSKLNDGGSKDEIKLKEDNQKLTKAIQELTDENKNLSKKIAAFENQKTTTESFENKKGKKAKNDPSNKEIQKNNEKEIAELNKKINELQSLLNTQSQLQENPDKENSKLENELKKLENENTQLKSTIVEINAAYENSIQSYNLLKNENASLIQKLNAQSSEVNNASNAAEIESLRNDLVKISEENKKNQNLVKEAEQHFKDLAQEINEKTLRINEQQKDIDKLSKLKDGKNNNTNEITSLKKDIQEKDRQIKLLTQKADLLAKKISEPDENKENKSVEFKKQSENNTLTESQQYFYNSLDKFRLNNPTIDLQLEIAQNTVKFIIPQNFLFEGETAALKEQGSNFIMKLAEQLRSAKAVYNIIAFTSIDSANKTYESNFRRANTISKLLGVSGISMKSYSIGARPFTPDDQARKILSGIEISMAAN